MKITTFLISIIFGISAFGCPVKTMLAARANIVYEDKNSPLPEGVYQVEYLESTGKEYINTGIYLTSDDIVTVKAMCFNRNSVFGVIESGTSFNLTGSGSGSIFRFGGGNIVIATSLNSLYLFQCGKDFLVDNVFIGTRDYSFSSSSPCFCFARSAMISGSLLPSDFLIGRIYWLKITSAGTINMYLIPVRVGEELIGAMYDVVSGELFYNQGTGDFIIGPDVRR